jgi:signal recognition particle receptor subunit beta
MIGKLTEVGNEAQEIAALHSIEKDSEYSTVDALVLLVDCTDPRSLRYAENIYETHILQHTTDSSHQQRGNTSSSRTRLSTLPILVVQTKSDLPRTNFPQVLISLQNQQQQQ